MDDATWWKTIIGAAGVGIGAFWRLHSMIKDVEKDSIARDRTDATEMRTKIGTAHDRINEAATKGDLAALENRVSSSVNLVREDVKLYRVEAGKQLERIMDKLDRMSGGPSGGGD